MPILKKDSKTKYNFLNFKHFIKNIVKDLNILLLKYKIRLILI